MDTNEKESHCRVTRSEISYAILVGLLAYRVNLGVPSRNSNIPVGITRRSIYSCGYSREFLSRSLLSAQHTNFARR